MIEPVGYWRTDLVKQKIHIEKSISRDGSGDSIGAQKGRGDNRI